MIIRSQDKKHTTTDMNLEIVTVKLVSWKDIPFDEEVTEEDEEVKWESKIYNSVGLLLGTYSTEEKAIKVLDMVCEHAEAMHFSKIVTNECGKIWGNVFDMPSDNEVEV